MWPNFVTFTEEIFNEKLHFLFSESIHGEIISLKTTVTE